MHPHPLVRRLFDLAEAKQTNIVLSADVTTTDSLLELADKLGTYIAVLKTHIDIVSDFSERTVQGLKELSDRHKFLIFEDRKLTDIGSTVQKQYHHGALRISEWAHIVNASVSVHSIIMKLHVYGSSSRTSNKTKLTSNQILPGEGIIDALSQSMNAAKSEYSAPRGLLLLAEMTSTGTLATGYYTAMSILAVRQHPGCVIGFVATHAMNNFVSPCPGFEPDEDFVVFTTGISRDARVDAIGQQYQTPENAIKGGSDFVIAGRGIYKAADPVEMVSLYRKEAWNAYLSRVAGFLSEGD